MFSAKMWYSAVALLLSILILAPANSQAQNSYPDSDWQIWLFHASTSHIIGLSPDGITDDIDLIAFSGLENEPIRRPLLSPDGHTLVFEIPLIADTYSAGTAGIYLTDLETQECCRRLTDPENPEFLGYHHGPFSPDGTQLVTSMWTDNNQLPPEVAVFDVTSGDIIHRLPLTELTIQPFFEDESFVEAAVFNEWNADGIRIGGTCRNCPASLIFFDHTQIWNPETGELSDPVTVTTDPLSVLATGELIKSTFDENVPGGDQPAIGIGEGVGLVYPSNIVRYYPDHSQPQSEIIFNRPEPPMIRSAHWVANGQRVFVFLDFDSQATETRQALVLDRDGGQQTLEFIVDDTFLAPTPDGWLMCQYLDGSKQIVYFQLIDDQIVSTEIALIEAGSTCYFSEFDVIGQNFVLGDGLNAPPFTP